MKTTVENGKETLSPFAVGDVIVYILIATLIASLFVFCATIFKSENEGVEIFASGEKVFSCRFDDDDFTIYENERFPVVTERRGDVLLLTVYADSSKTSHNDVEINFKEKTARVTDADCSPSKDCAHTPEIRNGKGAIICVPHKIKILPTGGKLPLTTG